MTERLPALPLIANDPYFSIWMPADTLTDTDTVHWSGAVKPIHGVLAIDQKKYRWLGRDNHSPMNTKELRVTPTQTISVLEEAGVRLEVRFWSPALPDDLDMLSAPVTYLDWKLESIDGMPHEVKLMLSASDRLCYEGEIPPQMTRFAYQMDELQVAWSGQLQQKPLSHSGDRITIDWGYLYLASRTGNVSACDGELRCEWDTKLSGAAEGTLMLAYDDIASINYFGTFCRAWYMRNGKTIADALREFDQRHDQLAEACTKLDQQVMGDALKAGGENYRRIACAAWRHTFAAHKLIATPEGEMAFLSKENDSGGCVDTVDVSYPSIPLFLKYCPELVNALCRPVLRFASLPVWESDFAPHDVGRYPYATGQMYALRKYLPNGMVYAPVCLYPAGTDVYDFRYQMPVEECGNMLIMLETAMTFGASAELTQKHLHLLEKWVKYLDEYGEDPGEQLCTDDFAGHLNRNVNLAAKAMAGVACYARIMRRMGREEQARHWEKRAHEMAKSWLERAKGEHSTALTFDGQGWSMKYNLVWDLVLGLDLMPASFYRQETVSYLSLMNEFGLPLDSRADYTKSDWLVWCASMAQDQDTFDKLIAPLAYYLQHTTSRVAFSDWYDTKTGCYEHFIGRSVQGGLYMPLIARMNRE